MVDQIVGRRTALRVAAGQLLMPTEFETAHVSVSPGRVQVTIPVDSYTASRGQVGPEAAGRTSAMTRRLAPDQGIHLFHAQGWQPPARSGLETPTEWINIHGRSVDAVLD